MSRIASLVKDLKDARRYTTTLLDAVDPADWFRQPAGCVTHVAWQAGHLAVAQYRLSLFLIRGQEAEDDRLISEDFVSRFAPGSVPDPDAESGPSAAEIREIFDRVHAQTIAETQALSDDILDKAIGFDHLMFSTKGGAIRWSAQHEFTHAGQISLLRRLLGNNWLW